MRRPSIILAFSMLTAGNLSAQEPSRVLNGYEFIPSRVVDGPFAISYFATTTGGGIAFDVKTPFIDRSRELPETLAGDVAFLWLSFKYQQQFGQWFAARFRFGGGARLGVDEQSVLAQGVTGEFSWNLGATARVFQSDRVIVSGALDLTRTELVGLDPLGFARKIIQEGLGAEDNSLVQTGEAISAVVSARAGWAPAPWLGVTAILEAGRGDVTGDVAEALFGGGATVGIDLKNLGAIPIGLQLIGQTDAFTQAGADVTARSWHYGFGIFYTGWREFSVGLETTMTLLERRDTEDDFEAFIATFNLRYWP